MPPDAVQRYAEFVAKAFAEFEPIYMISGDMNFGSKDTSQACLVALETIKSICPGSLTTMHIWGDSAYLPEEIGNQKLISTCINLATRDICNRLPINLLKIFTIRRSRDPS